MPNIECMAENARLSASTFNSRKLHIACQYLGCKQFSKHCDIWKKLGLKFRPYIAASTGFELMISYHNLYHLGVVYMQVLRIRQIIGTVIRLHHQLASWFYLRKPSLRATAPLQFHHRKFLFPWPRQGAAQFKDSSQKLWPQPSWSYVTFFHQESLRSQLIYENRQIFFVDCRITCISPFVK